MPSSPLKRVRRVALWLLLDLVLFACLLGFSTWADSSSSLRRVPAGSCYCGCSQAKTSAGCAKMCELPKYASRWWAVTCKKPRNNAPAETPDAGPRVPHPARSERASAR
jgi:hypothetical protein